MHFQTTIQALRFLKSSTSTCKFCRTDSRKVDLLVFFFFIKQKQTVNIFNNSRDLFSYAGSYSTLNSSPSMPKKIHRKRMSKTTMLKTDLEIKELRFFFQTQNLRESEYTVKDSSDLTE